MAEYNTTLVNDSINDAQQKANQAYSEAKARNEAETLAQAKAAQAWKETMDKAGLTGMYEGQYTMPTQQAFATMFGTWGAPTQGQQTQSMQQQQFGQGATLANMYGQYYAPGQTPTAGMQTQTAQEQAYTQWLRSQQQALAVQTQQQQAANQYLTLLSSLRGPADWYKYQQVLGAGGNMNSLAAAMMGQYVPGGGATSGYQPQAADLNTLYGQVQAAGQPNYQGLNPNQFSYQAPQQGGPQQVGGPTTPQYDQQPSQAQNATGNGTNTMGAPQNQMNLPAPNQIAAQSWNNLTPSQQQLALGQYESQGWDKGDVTALMNQSLPKYAANAPGAGTWRLR